MAKSTTQLDREIAEFLAADRKTSHAHAGVRTVMSHAQAIKIVHKLVAYDTEYGWRPEGQQDVRSKIEEWRDEAASAIAAGRSDPWFRDIEDAIAVLGPQAEIVYRRRVDEIEI
jgi:hypothetical protein